MTTESEFLDVSAASLLQSMGRIEASLARLTPEQIWFRHSENENAIGNLLLHLRGNVTQWILAGVGGAPDHRDRNAEFDARASTDTPAELLSRLRSTVEEAAAFLRTLPHSRLHDALATQGYDTTVLAGIYHVVEHFSGHTFQIIFMTKWLTGSDLGFYRHLRATGSSPKPDSKLP